MGVIQQMIDQVEGQVEALDNGILQIENQIEEYNEEIDALENIVGGDATSTTGYAFDMREYLEGAKSTELALTYNNGEIYTVYGATYGVYDYVGGNITDWVIWYWEYAPVPPPILPRPVPIEIYIYEGVGWDADATILALIDDWAWVNDYLTRPLDTGATYGLIPNRDALIGAAAILEADKLKLEQSVTELEPFA